MGIGNTFGATVLSSYGGFWISVAITFIPGGFKIMPTLEEAGGGTTAMFYDSFALFLWVSLSPSPPPLPPQPPLPKKEKKNNLINACRAGSSSQQ